MGTDPAQDTLNDPTSAPPTSLQVGVSIQECSGHAAVPEQRDRDQAKVTTCTAWQGSPSPTPSLSPLSCLFSALREGCREGPEGLATALSWLGGLEASGKGWGFPPGTLPTGIWDFLSFSWDSWPGNPGHSGIPRFHELPDSCGSSSRGSCGESEPTSAWQHPRDKDPSTMHSHR